MEDDQADATKMLTWEITQPVKPGSLQSKIVGTVTGDTRSEAWEKAQALYGVVDGKVWIKCLTRPSQDLLENLESHKGE